MDKDKEVVSVNYKPVIPQIVSIIAGCLLCFLGNWAAISLGLFLVAIALIVQFFVNDYKVYDFYSDRIEIFNEDGSLNAKVYYDDIVEWNINRVKQNSLYIRLKDNSIIMKESFLMGKVNKQMRRYVFNKETMQIKLEESRKRKFKNPFKKKETKKEMPVDIKRQYFDILKKQINAIYNDQSDKIKELAEMIVDTMINNGVVQLFGVKHGNEFVNELNFRAGGMAPYHGMNVNILDLKGKIDHKSIADNSIYDDVLVVPTLLNEYKLDDRDMIILVSQEGNEKMIVEIAKIYKEKHQKVVAIVNKASYDVSEVKSKDGKLLDYADMYLDMCSLKEDIALNIEGYKVGQTSSTAANVLAQMLTAEIYRVFKDRNLEAPVLLSANVKGADVHNKALTDVYEGRVR